MKLVITGGIASGKSAVTEILAKKGFSIIDADEVYRGLTSDGSDLNEVLRREFGDEIVREGVLDRAALKKIAFSTQANTEKLNALTHGAVLAEIEKLLVAARGNVAVAVPLYFEAGWKLNGIEEVWSVACDRETRIKRLCLRDTISREQAERVMARQWTDEERAALCDRVIENNGTKESLEQKIENALEGR